MTDNDNRARHDRILEERAKRLASVPPAATTRNLLCQVAIVLVGKTHIGIAVEALREVRHAVPITPLRGLPEGMLGIAQVHGSVLCIIDLSRWIGTEERGTGGCLVTITGPKGQLGVIADGCAGFRDIYEDDIVPNATGHNACRVRYVRGITKDSCILLDVPRLLDDPRLIVGAPPTKTSGGSL